MPTVTNFCEKGYRCVTMSINFYLILYNRNKILFSIFIIELFVFISTHLDEGKVSIVCVLLIVHGQSRDTANIGYTIFLLYNIQQPMLNFEPLELHSLKAWIIHLYKSRWCYKLKQIWHNFYCLFLRRIFLIFT
jgi:hypothetical protein